MAANGTPSLIHIHGVSIGEMLAAVPVIDSILVGTDTSILLTYWTKTSEKLAHDRFAQNPRIRLARLPIDLPWNHARFYKDHPVTSAIFIDSEIWPGWLMAMKKRRIPVMVINGRLSPRSYNNWMRVRWFMRFCLSHFTRIDAQSDADTQRFNALGGHAATMPVNLKYLRDPLPVDTKTRDALKQSIGNRPVVFYTCTHDGDEDMAFRIHKNLRARYPDLLTLIVPRHPHRVDALIADTEKAGLIPARRSALSGAPFDVLYGDTIGEMGLYYSLATLVVIGKSFNPDHPGGQNPIEGAQLGCPLLCGPYMTNFPGVMDDFKAADAIIETRDETDLEHSLAALLSDPDAAKQWGIRAQTLTTQKTTMGADYLRALNAYLLKSSSSHLLRGSMDSRNKCENDESEMS